MQRKPPSHIRLSTVPLGLDVRHRSYRDALAIPALCAVNAQHIVAGVGGRYASRMAALNLSVHGMRGARLVSSTAP